MGKKNESNFKYRKLSELTLLAGNPRIIKTKEFETLCKSVKDNPSYFEARPLILSDRTGQLVVIAGNQRYKAAESLGLKEVPTFLLSGLTKKKEEEIIIRDNVSNGSWNFDELANSWNQDDLLEWGVELPFLDGKEEAEEDDFEIPETVKTKIVLGDLIEIGRHRLLCGDSTQADSYKTLADGDKYKPLLMVTDPPYGVNYDADWRNHALRKDGSTSDGRAIGKVTNDNRSDWSESFALFTGDVCYVWHGDKQAMELQQNLKDSDFVLVAQIIWVKQQFVIGRGDYHFKHEPCFYGVKKGKKHNWQGSRKETSVWEIDKPVKSETGHSTQKPVECMAKPITNNTAKGDCVYDPFLGSGTSMVAAHQLDRICIGMEISPEYCQVQIDRMLKLDPSLLVKINGKPYKKTSK